MAFNFPPGPNYTDIQSQLLFTTDIIELTSNLLLACPISIINFILILKTSIIHPNLKLIILCQSLCIFIRGIGRIILNIVRIYIKDYTTIGPSILVIIYMQPINFRNCIMHVIVIERIIATLKSKNYEKNRNILFSFIWITITTVFAFVNAYATNVFASIQMINLITFFALIVFGILEIWGFFWILNHNRKCYEKKLKEGYHLLSERYQLSENIRTAKQLIPCILMHLVCILIPGIFSCCVYANFFTEQFTIDFVGQCVYTIITIGNFFIELFMIIFHPFLKRDLIKIFNSFRLRRSGGVADSNRVVEDPSINEPENLTLSTLKKYKQPMDINGNPLIANEKKEELGGEYFKQLNALWK
ncbi:hypothetical protein Mgra_00009562 [Meloidogyne graminicola]|uniref:G_PROTEIN_RECEP_F1_2 domain-containing protein n=1 Tax=Meloidogyne graminicola TaxID=189291 RepID=A0A8S9ZB61_9BILA|nr:hypothetical protein Mgra_00009562 [Meloidogyne graminicola]